MPRVRKCANCGKPALKPVSREMAVFSSVIHYKCDACGTEVELTPTASIGVTTTVGLMAILFWGSILLWDKSRPGVVAIGLFCLAVLALGFITIVPIVKHLLNPAIRSAPPVNLLEEKPSAHIGKHLIIWIERFGFLAGLVAPVILTISGLALAALIGFVNYTYFGN